MSINENTIIDFIYPAIITVKGCNEILIYSITDDIYYYMVLNAPILFKSSTVSNCNIFELRLYLDMGEYLIYSILSFSVGSASYFSMSYYKRYLEKSIFPKEMLLWGFDPISTNFIKKEELAFTLQFSGTIVTIGLLTHGLFQQIDSDYERGELIQIADDSFYSWKKGNKAISCRPIPISFADR